MVTEVPVVILDTELFTDKLKGAILPSENKSFSGVNSDLAGSYGIMVVLSKLPTFYLIPIQADCVVIGDAILDKGLGETGAECGEVKVLVSDGVGDVPVAGIGCIQRTGVASQPVNVGDAGDVITVPLNRRSLVDIYVAS